jgi:hypothetical protein
MLKFRLPWDKGNSEYLNGKIYLPIWGPQTTTEVRMCAYVFIEKVTDTTERPKRTHTNAHSQTQSRLIVSGTETVQWDHQHYENQMFYFNTVRFGV